jgi:hypothetical protein
MFMSFVQKRQVGVLVLLCIVFAPLSATLAANPSADGRLDLDVVFPERFRASTVEQIAKLNREENSAIQGAGLLQAHLTDERGSSIEMRYAERVPLSEGQLDDFKQYLLSQLSGKDGPMQPVKTEVRDFGGAKWIYLEFTPRTNPNNVYMIWAIRSFKNSPFSLIFTANLSEREYIAKVAADVVSSVRTSGTKESVTSADLQRLRANAERGDVIAMHSLATVYQNGIGVDKDLSQSVLWHHKAAQNGHVVSMYNYGVFLAQGVAIKQDYAEALIWFEKAALLRHSRAMFNAGLQHARGWGTGQDLSAAYAWFTLSAQSATGKEQAAANQARQSVTQRMSAVQMETANQMLRKLVEKMGR